MAKWEFLIFVALTTLVCCTEVEDSEQKKRGTTKGTTLNSIPSGAQKQDYTYSIYSQNPSSSSPSSPSYQSQVPSSFYPTQGSSQYYTQNPQETSYVPQQQPQINLLPPSSSSQFLPLNFVPNPGYQSKYQIVPSKTGGIQLTFLQPQNGYPTQSIVPFGQNLFSQNPQVNSHQAPIINPLQQGNYNVAPNYQPFGGSFQQSPMLLFAQPNPQSFSNLLYSNPLQNLYNYYPGNSQNKVNVQYVQSGSPEYEKLQGPISQAVQKDDNDIAHSSEYATTSDSSSSYKNAYAASRNTYAKL